MKDRLGKKINIGDTVVACEVDYQELIVGIVVKFTPKMVAFKRNTNDDKIIYRHPSCVAIVQTLVAQ